ncbi:MAG: PAS domain-containing protein [Caulobacterales bacterium]|nr:PAS domain-containing protein [Caulobacterales bacterium]
MTARATPFPIVGVGASAGGVEALEALFRSVPPNPGCAFVVVTHLGHDRRSLLPEIIARYTDMDVRVAEDGAELGPNQVHVLQTDARLDIEGGRLKVVPVGQARRERRPIDIFFSALALDKGERAVGVVLSGGDTDGTLGIKAIKERGGLTLAQIADGHPPQHPDMPDSAIASGMVDLAIPAKDMGARLAEFAASLALFENIAQDSQRLDSERRLKAARQQIYAIMRNQLGHDFSGYKEKTFLRRVQRRMQVNRIDELDNYVERLRQDPKEVSALFRDLLINVTNFFRDADAFKALETTVVPKLFAGRGADDTVRVWIPGCATGEEVFSIAILMREHMDTLPAPPRVQIFATDIDEPALAVARAARYPEALLDSVSDARRQRFFSHEDGSYQLTKDVRDLCVFSPHSVLRDPPFSRLDLISCRNLLIYFGADAQNQVLPTFHYSLRPGGYLFLGTSENASQFADLFTPVDKKQRIFRARDDARASVRLPVIVGPARPTPFAPPIVDRTRRVAGLHLSQTIEAHVLHRYTPAHVAVSRDGDVVYYSGRTGKYLEATPGAPSRQILSMARRGLRLDLRTALREAIETDRRVVREGLIVEADDNRVQRLNLSVEPIGEPGDERLFLIVFADVGPVVRREEAGVAGPPDEIALQLDRELRETRDRLQSLIEEYETALEELKSSNEELVSVNEELQSTNEELEASKEELQSLNEELHTVNAELQGKVEQLDRANSDLTNLFESTRVATVFLDRKLAIRSYTPAVSQIFNILPSDRGRPLTDLVSQVEMPSLAADARRVIETGKTIERTLDHDHGKAHYLLRLVPYLDTDQTLEGVVLTLVDVTSLTQAEAQEKLLIDELNHRVKNMLTVVIGVAEQTIRTSPDLAAFKTRFIDRVHSMARSYELLSRQHWTDASVEELIRPHLDPFGPERVRFGGPPVRLKPKQSLSLGMIIHELATNASKYGALSRQEGDLEIGWAERPGGESGAEFDLSWRERNGPEISGRPRRGFGLTLVERETTHSLQGKAEIKFEPDGLDVRLTFPK